MLNHKRTREIRTERLLLREVKPEDYKDMYGYLSRREMTRYVSYPTHKSMDDTKAICEKWAKEYKSGDRYNWAIVYNNVVIGNIDVVELLETTAYMGWQIDINRRNKGFMTEAAAAVRDYLFSEIGIDAIAASHMEPNIASGRVMQKIGMKQLPTEKSAYFKLKGTCEMNGIPVISYSLTKEEWQCRTTQ